MPLAAQRRNDQDEPGRQHHLASEIEEDPPSSSRAPTILSQRHVRDSIELRSLLGSSKQNGRRHSPLAEKSDEVEASSGTKPPLRKPSLSRSYSVEEEKAIVRKFDKRLVLFMALLYMLSFLDRSSQAFLYIHLPCPTVSPTPFSPFPPQLCTSYAPPLRHTLTTYFPPQTSETHALPDSRAHYPSNPANTNGS
jgi:hypothetical protein